MFAHFQKFFIQSSKIEKGVLLGYIPYVFFIRRKVVMIMEVTRSSYLAAGMESQDGGGSHRSKKIFVFSIKSHDFSYFPVSLQLYTVVRHVKGAADCQESGESQQFADDIEYLLDGLKDTENPGTRCLRYIAAYLMIGVNWHSYTDRHRIYVKWAGAWQPLLLPLGTTCMYTYTHTHTHTHTPLFLLLNVDDGILNNKMRTS